MAFKKKKLISEITVVRERRTLLCIDMNKHSGKSNKMHRPKYAYAKECLFYGY